MGGVKRERERRGLCRGRRFPSPSTRKQVIGVVPVHVAAAVPGGASGVSRRSRPSRHRCQSLMRRRKRTAGPPIRQQQQQCRQEDKQDLHPCACLYSRLVLRPPVSFFYLLNKWKRERERERKETRHRRPCVKNRQDNILVGSASVVVVG